jgi:hypothetical protein
VGEEKGAILSSIQIMVRVNLGLNLAGLPRLTRLDKPKARFTSPSTDGLPHRRICMTRVTNFGRKRKYLEAGFVTELTSTANEPSVPEVNTASDDQGDSVHPKKKRKRTKKPKVDGGDEQAPGGIEVGGEMGVQTKGEGPSAGQKMTKKRGGAKSGHCISSFAVEG